MSTILKIKSVGAFVLLLGVGLLLTPACGNGGTWRGEEPPAGPTGRAVLGPLAGADLEIFEVRGDGTFPLVHAQTTSEGDTLDECGWFDPVPVPLDPNTLYVFKASGGDDVDADDDGVKDAVPTRMKGSVRALVRGSQAAAGNLKLNALTEVLYHRVAYMLIARYSQTEIAVALDECTLFLLRADVDGNGTIDAADALRWDPATDRADLRKSWDHFEDLLDAIHDGDQGWVAWESESIADSSIAFHRFEDPVQDVHVVGDRAYVAIEDTGFAIVDVSDPRAPEVLSVVDNLGNGEDLGVQGDYVYFARRDDGPMQIYDVSDPTNPVPRGSLGMDTPDCMCPTGDLLYAVERDDHRIRIVDISDPDAPVEITTIQTLDDPNQVVAVGDYLYVADEDYLVVLDVSDPEAPFHRADIEAWRGDIDGLAVQGGYAYCADGESGLLVVDVSDLDNLDIVAHLPSRCECDRVWIEGSLLYMSAREAGVQVIDISTPTNPTLVGYCTVANRARVTCTAGGYAFVACDGGGLRILDPSEPAAAVYADVRDDLILGTIDTGENNQDVVASGNYAYVAVEDGLVVVDITDPTAPTLAWSDLTWGNQSQALTMQGDMLYVAAESRGLQIVDVSNPLSPDVKPPFGLSDEAQDVAVQGNYAYVADRYNAEFIVVDVSDPDAPLWEGDVWTPVGDSIRSVAVQSTWGFGAWGFSGLQSVDVSDPTDPVIVDGLELHDVGSMDPDFAHKVALIGNYAYVLAEELHIVDISDPSNLSLVRTYEINADENVAVAGDFAFVAEDTEGIRVLNATDPTDPWTFTKLSSFGQSRSVYVHGGLLLVTNREKGLVIMRAPFTTDLP